MKQLILQNWKAKVISLIVAVAVWYVVKGHVQQTERSFSPIPGAQQGSSGPFVPGYLPAVAQLEAEPVFHRLHWLELEHPDGGIGVTAYPGYRRGDL